MLILLPPSEGKSRPTRGACLNLAALSFPELAGYREEIITALVAVSDSPAALVALGVGASMGDEVVANVNLRSAPTARAERVYSGVLYGALGLPSLSAAGRRRAAKEIVIISALYGAVRPGDRIPAYRLSMSGRLPGVEPLARYWRRVLDEPLTSAAGRGPIIDCRSSTYAAAWTPPESLASQWVQVHVPGATHHAKFTRGLVARQLLERTGTIRSIADVADVLSSTHDVSLAPATSARKPAVLSVRP